MFYKARNIGGMHQKVHIPQSPDQGIWIKTMFGCHAFQADNINPRIRNGAEPFDGAGLHEAMALVRPCAGLFRDKKRGDIPNEMIEKAKEDVWYIEIFENEKRKGTRITYNEWKRYRLAKERVKILVER